MFRFAQVGALVVMLAACATPVIDEQAFSARYAELVSASFDVEVAVVAPLEVQVMRSGGETSTSYLDNAYSEYLADPAMLDAVLARFVNAAGEMLTKDTAGAIENLFPVIKGRGYLDEVREIMRNAEGVATDTPFPLYYEPLNEDLVVLYAFDSEASIRFASSEDIESLGVSDKALQVRAVDNLLASLPDIGREGDAGLSLVVADGNYEASLLLYDELWSRDVFRVVGDIVVFVPARDVLLVTGSEDAAGLARARALIESNEFAYAISPHAYLRTADGWARFDP